MVAGRAEVEDSIEIGSLSGGGEYSCDATFEFCYLCSYCIIGGVGKACIEIAALLKVEESGHLFGCGIFESSALYDGEHPWLTVFRFPTSLHANRAGIQIIFHIGIKGFQSYALNTM